MVLDKRTGCAAGRPPEDQPGHPPRAGRPPRNPRHLLAAETRPDEVVLGIHYRVLMSEDGQRVLEMAPLSRAPIVIPLAEGGTKAEAIWVTNILTDYPMEQHVFASLLHHGLPIYVSTARGLWEVRGPEVRYVGER